MPPEKKSSAIVPVVPANVERKADECSTRELIAELVKIALQLPAQERRAFLEQRCGPDATLRAEAESLLEQERGMCDFLERPALHVAAETLTRDRGLRAGEAIGRYEIISLVGRGGMGEVYLAQDRHLHRRVAVKLVRRGMDAEDILRRFVHEQRLLASLNHPNIAQLYEAGLTPDGIPFFAMEHVEGTRIDDYCREKNLAIRQRLELFCKVCSAINYAHQHLIVHRDIKPSNIVVTAEGEPKLLDFGIAKLLDAVTNSAPEQTLTLQNVLTPDYASPEQVRSEPITTASDVYSLGVLLYELLTGAKPYKIDARTPVEIERIITEVEPAKPSTAIARADRDSSSRWPDAAARPYHAKQLRGDLDNIVLVAMRKEPQRRYASAAQFAADLGRHLDGLPVIAHKDTFAYRASKFVGRHRVGVAAAAVIFLTLAGGLIGIAWQARVAANERDQARVEKAKAEQVNAFLQEMLGSADPLKKGSNVKVADVLADATRRAQTNLANQPEVQAEVLRTIGNTYSGLALFTEGEPLLRQALEMHRRLFGPKHRETAKTLFDLAQLMRGKGDFGQAEALFREALAIQKTLAPRGDSDTGNVLFYLGDALFQHGRTNEAEKLFLQSLETARRAEVNDVLCAGLALNGLGLVQEYRGDLSGAENFYRQATEALRNTQSATVSLVLMNLATNLTSQKKYDEADAIFGQALNRSRDLYGKNHPNVAMVMTHYGRMYSLKGEYSTAERILREAVEIERKTLPPGHAESAQTLVTLGLVLVREGEPKQGEPYLREALDIRERALPNGHWTTANVRSMLGECLTEQQRYAEAEPLLRRGYDEIKAALGENHPRTVEAAQRLARYRKAIAR